MSLNIYLPPPAERAEQAGLTQRLTAILGLCGLVLAWAVVLLPCAVWLLFRLVVNRFQATPSRQQAYQET